MVRTNLSAGLIASLVVVTAMSCSAEAQNEIAKDQNELAEEQSSDAFLLPSFAVGAYYNDAFLELGERSLEEVAEQYLDVVQQENLSEYERFALGQLCTTPCRPLLSLKS